MQITVGNSLRIAVIGTGIYWLLATFGFLLALEGKSDRGDAGFMLLVATSACTAGFFVMMGPTVFRSIPLHWKRAKLATIGWVLWILLPIPPVVLIMFLVARRIVESQTH